MLHPYAFNGKNTYFSPGKNKYTTGSTNQSNSPKQSISFKGFNAPAPLPNDYFDDCWSKLNQALEKILTSSQPPEGLQNLYQLCQILCRNNQGEKIYKQLEQVFEASSKQKLKTVLTKFDSKDFLSEFNKEWKAYQQQIKTINTIFSYLDQTLIRKTPQLIPLSKLALHKFNEALQNDPNCKRKVSESLIFAIFQLKSGKHMDRESIRNLLEMLILLNIYQNSFEDELLAHTQQFYQIQATEHLSHSTLKEYIEYVEKTLDQEKDFITNYLQGQTEKPIMNILFIELVKNHGEKIIKNQGFNSLFEDHDHLLMKNIYSLYKHVGIIETLQNTLCESITIHTNEIVRNMDSDPQAVHKLVWLNNTCMKYLTQAMEHNSNIYDSIKKCFSKAFSGKSIIIAQKLCWYFHHFLMNPSSVSSKMSSDQIVQNGIQIFRLNESKDIFEDLYRHQLSNRLITNGAIHMDLEQSMVNHLREVSNLDFTHNLEGMLRDISTSQELTSKFNENSNLNNMQLDFRIFSSYHWPSHSNIDFILPDRLLQLQKKFEQFYTNKYPDKKLSWSHALGTCKIHANFSSGAKEFTTNCFQASILLLFDELDKDMLSYSEIIQYTKIPSKELNISLESLCNGSIPILERDTLNSSLEDCHFAINHRFIHESDSIRINDMKSLQVTPVESEIKQKTFLDRQHQVDSILIRMMKNASKCKINLLETELNSALSFKVTKSQFDQRIQYLVDKGYLEHSEEDPSIIVYIP